MLSVNGTESLVGKIIDEIPPEYELEVMGEQFKLSDIHEWSKRMAKFYQVSMFGIDFNAIKLSSEYNDYQIFPSKEKKEKLIKDGKFDLLIGPKTSEF
jgi:hypothetical protein